MLQTLQASLSKLVAGAAALVDNLISAISSRTNLSKPVVAIGLAGIIVITIILICSLGGGSRGVHLCARHQEPPKEAHPQVIVSADLRAIVKMDAYLRFSRERKEEGGYIYLDLQSVEL